MAVQFRIGQGTDVHQLVAGRPLIVGGVRIQHDKGLLGHSDADVLIHALMDALLGAAGHPDIGQRFPNTDMQWKDASSVDLLSTLWAELRREGWKLVNFDSTIIAEAPRFAPHIPAMKKVLSTALDVEASCCGIKAGTFEKLGSLGRGEGIMASCVALLQKEG